MIRVGYDEAVRTMQRALQGLLGGGNLEMNRKPDVFSRPERHENGLALRCRAVFEFKRLRFF